MKKTPFGGRGRLPKFNSIKMPYRRREVTEKKSIYQKILAVQMDAKMIPKSGYNAFNKYHYCTEADVLVVKELLNMHGLIAFPSVEKYETLHRGESVQTLLHIKYTVVDAETGESIECFALGQGEDKGDKGAYKAATGANKYFYLKFAGCPTGDDPEKQDEAPKKPAAVSRKPAAAPPQVSPQAEAQAVGAKILALQKQYGLTNEQVLKAGSLTSLKDTIALNDVPRLNLALELLQAYVQQEKRA